MKILKIGGAALVAVALLVGGLLWNADTPTEDNEAEQEQREAELIYYRELSAMLETELDELQAEHTEQMEAYEERIAALELLLQQQEPEEKTESSKAVFTYTVENNGVIITGYSGEEKTLEIPATIDGLAVVAIGREAFKESSLVEVVLPTTLKKIDWFAFYGSKSLERAVIPTSVSKIEYGVFDGCDRLTVCCEKNSYADKYARSYGMRVEN